MNLKYLIASLLAPLIMSACSSAPPNPVIPKPIPFAINKAGNKVVINFEARKDNVELNAEYVVTLLFKGANDILDPIVFFREHPPLPFNIKISKFDGAVQSLIKIESMELTKEFNFKKYPTTIEQNENNGIVYAVFYYSSGDGGAISVASFRPRSYGHYRAEIEALQDQPNLSNISSSLTIQKYFIGK